MNAFAGRIIAGFLLLSAAVSVQAAVLYSAAGGQVKTLDPVLADDLASRDLTALVYDTLLQYDYTGRPYRLVPSMLKRMPVVSENFSCYEFELRDDLFFHSDPLFPDRKARRVTSEDVKFSLLRFADSRLHSPVYWMFRGKIAGLDEFREKTAAAGADDWSMYELDIPGIKILSEKRFVIRLTRPDPRFLYMLAIPNSGIVSKAAVRRYGRHLERAPVGSGPFVLKKWIHNLQLEFVRNPDFRLEYFKDAPDPADRLRPLPLLDGITIYQVRQPMTAWMMFLQGRIDFNALDKDNRETLLDRSGNLIPALKKRQIRLFSNPEFEIRYIGFNFDDPKLRDNLKLRQALSLSYNVPRRIAHAGGQLLAVQNAIPPGVAGADSGYRNEFAVYDLERAAKLLTEAGFPGGIDPETGEKLTLTLDLSGNDTAHRQMGELAADDWRKLGIKVIPQLNSKPRFFEKLRQKKFQLFRLSWVGDYPDAENFLQLFYSGNRSSSNRTGFSNRRFDQMFEESRGLPDSPRRSELYRQMAALAASHCVWIHEGIPVSGVLCHGFVKNYLECDFAFMRWKYLDIDENLRRQLKKEFRPLSVGELSGR